MKISIILSIEKIKLSTYLFSIIYLSPWFFRQKPLCEMLFIVIVIVPETPFWNQLPHQCSGNRHSSLVLAASVMYDTRTNVDNKQMIIVAKIMDKCNDCLQKLSTIIDRWQCLVRLYDSGCRFINESINKVKYWDHIVDWCLQFISSVVIDEFLWLLSNDDDNDGIIIRWSWPSSRW